MKQINVFGRCLWKQRKNSLEDPYVDSFWHPLEQRKSEGILEDWNRIGKFPISPFRTKDLVSSYESYEIHVECHVS